MRIVPTPAAWIDAVLGDFDSFLQDHASCEKKASGMALSIASHYPDKPDILRAMTDLAVEELNHYREVIRILIDRGIPPVADTRDAYVRALNDLIRRGPEHYLLDRLLIAAVVERRGNERFGLIAEALTTTHGGEDPLAAFYRAITGSEARHWAMFVQLAEVHCGKTAIANRLEDLLEAEGALMLAQPFRPALH